MCIRDRDFINTDCPDCGKSAIRETDTMDTFIDSSWYFLRFPSPNFEDGPFEKQQTSQWNPVHQYTGGVEHAVMHLLYSRFFVKAARDLGLIDFDEPFLRLFNQGTIIYQGAKMSKSRGNVIAPDDYVSLVGADTVRTYLMFIGPWEQGGEWNDSGINGATRWLNRVWDVSELPKECSSYKSDPDIEKNLIRLLHKTIKKVGEDIDNFNNNYEINFEIPSSLNQAIKISKNNNPNLIISKLEYEQSEKDVQIAKSDLSPSATLSFETKETDDLSASYDQQDKETVQATITWPIFSGGKNYAGLGKSKNLRNRKKLLLDNAVKVNDTNVASAWSNMKSNGSLLESVKLQVKAAEIANEGITAEYESGKGRSTLDVIQSNSILLNSKISLANSEREYLLSQFKLLQSVGILSANSVSYTHLTLPTKA